MAIDKKREDFDTESAWQTYCITHADEEPEEIEEETEQDISYMCKNPKCDFIVTVKKSITESQLEEIKELLATGICPKCGKKGFKYLTYEEYEKELKLIKERKRKEKEEEKAYKDEMVSESKSILKDTNDDIKKLYKDLKNKLETSQINAKTFCKLFYNISFDIMQRTNKYYRKKYYTTLIDLKSERKTILEMGQIVLDLYGELEDQEQILIDYDEASNEEYLAIYNAYNAKYEHEDEVSFSEYESQTRLDNYMKDIQRKRAILGKSVERSKGISKRNADKYQTKEENTFAKSLDQYVNKISKE